MNRSQKDYHRLHKISLHARILSGIVHILDWDQETYMPSGAASIRSIQLETLAGLIHSEKTGKKFAGALRKLVDLSTGKVLAKGLKPEQHAALREWRRDYLREKALPKKFVEKLAKVSSQSILAWRAAKKNNAFDDFAPFLEKLVEMNKKKADFLGYEEHPYDALIDQYEPGMKTKEIAILFGSLRKKLGDLLKKIGNSSRQGDDSFLYGKFPSNKQLEFSRRLLNDMGYKMENGRLDLSSHPFSSAVHPTDSRVTTRIHPSSLMSCLSAALHEGGHALYEMGLPEEHYGSPLGDALSLGVHESQSRWWETRIGQSKPFWQHYLPLLQKEFPKKFDVSLDTFYRAVNYVKPSLIRVEADEVTYPLHILLRFELEKGLFENAIKIKDIPEAWNGKMQELLGITPSNDAEGCLQDIHWSMGGFGYFPTYTLGTLYAAHLFDAFEKEHRDWEARVAHGELLFIKDWLHEKIYRYGKQFPTLELLKKATGKKFTAQPFLSYLHKKYENF